MSKHIVVVGFGPGISTAVAERFGSEAFAVTLIARNEERLRAGVASLNAKGVHAVSFAADAGQPSSIAAAIREARAALGPVTVLHWNAYGGAEVRDVLASEAPAIRSVFDVAVVGLLAAVREAMPDLSAAGDGAVLVTNGAFGEISPMIDAYATRTGAVGVALANAAKHKLVGLLAERLKGDGVHVGEVMVAGAVKGTAFAEGQEGIEAAAIAAKFWSLYQGRSEILERVS